MKEKTSTILSLHLLKKVVAAAYRKLSRSTLVERVLGAYFRDRERSKIHARDLDLINAAADRLNAEAEEILVYQELEN